MEQAPGAITELIRSCDDDDALLAQAFPLIYAELKQIAHRALLRAQGNATLSTTALVHEAYVKLAGGGELDLAGRRHLFALCACAMRQIVIDHARRRQSDKRGGGAVAITLQGIEIDDAGRPEALLALDQALRLLAERDTRLVRLIKYRVFAGLDPAEIAELLGVSVRSVQRDWQRARIWVGEALEPLPVSRNLPS
jgi:RNA polymerase sigma factor (TIGR02999 family)